MGTVGVFPRGARIFSSIQATVRGIQAGIDVCGAGKLVIWESCSRSCLRGRF